MLGTPDRSPTHEDLARRAGECVNACAGLAGLVGFVADLREFLPDRAEAPTGHHFSGRPFRLLAKPNTIEDLLHAQ